MLLTLTGWTSPRIAEAFGVREDTETVQNVGVVWGCPAGQGAGVGMKWRVLMELVGPDGGLQVHEISAGASPTDGTAAAVWG